MSNYKNQVLELVKQRPGVRVFQISDLLDLDVDIVEGILAQAVREELIVVEQVMGPNKRLTNAYSYAGAMPQGLDKQEVADTVKVPEEVREAPKAGPVAVIPAAPIATMAAPTTATAPAAPAATVEPVRTAIADIAATPVTQKVRIEPVSKASIALDYLKKHGATDRATLVEVMGLTKKYQVEQYLKNYTSNGRLVRIEEIYCIPDHPAAAAKAAAADSAPAVAVTVTTSSVPAADPVHSPSHYTSGGIEVIDVLRAKLTPEEFRGFLKGNVIKYMLRAEHKGGAQDYKKGCVYATWLAEQSIAQAA